MAIIVKIKFEEGPVPKDSPGMFGIGLTDDGRKIDEQNRLVGDKILTRLKREKSIEESESREHIIFVFDNISET